MRLRQKLAEIMNLVSSPRFLKKKRNEMCILVVCILHSLIPSDEAPKPVLWGERLTYWKSADLAPEPLWAVLVSLLHASKLQASTGSRALALGLARLRVCVTLSLPTTVLRSLQEPQWVFRAQHLKDPLPVKFQRFLLGQEALGSS